MRFALVTLLSCLASIAGAQLPGSLYLETDGILCADLAALVNSPVGNTTRFDNNVTVTIRDAPGALLAVVQVNGGLGDRFEANCSIPAEPEAPRPAFSVNGLRSCTLAYVIGDDAKPLLLHEPGAPYDPMFANAADAIDPGTQETLNNAVSVIPFHSNWGNLREIDSNATLSSNFSIEKLFDPNNTPIGYSPERNFSQIMQDIEKFPFLYNQSATFHSLSGAGDKNVTVLILSQPEYGFVYFGAYNSSDSPSFVSRLLKSIWFYNGTTGEWGSHTELGEGCYISENERKDVQCIKNGQTLFFPAKDGVPNFLPEIEQILATAIDGMVRSVSLTPVSEAAPSPSSPSPAPTSTDEPSKAKGLSAAVKAGIGIGAVAGVAFLIICFALWYRYFKGVNDKKRATSNLPVASVAPRV